MAGSGSAHAEHGARIALPDRRLRVFVSSTMEELAVERRAVREAVTGMRLTPVLFEVGARPHPPRELYRAYLEHSDVFVGMYGERYGWIAPDMAVSGLEDEYELSEGKPRLLYVREPAPAREPRLQELIVRMQAESGASTVFYRDATELAELVRNDLAVLLSERFTAGTPSPPGLAAGWLPTPSGPLVDREAERATVTGLLRDPAVRLVTLTGPGGVGKTRLALASAADLEQERDGVWFVDLAAVRDPADVPATIAAAVGVPAEGRVALLDVVADRLAGHRVLLVLDNVEQVLAAAPELARLLSRCPRTQLLVTSRSTLRLSSEHDVPLAPLSTPPDGEQRPQAIATSPAVELFVTRARQADPWFALTETTAGPVAETVRRLEGLPLAIELVAVRVRTLPPQALLRRLDRALDLAGTDVDAPERQRTLRATIAWSYDLLDEPARAVLARLSVCVDGCTVDMAEAVGTVDGDVDVLDCLSSLVGHSLLEPIDAGQGELRFRMSRLLRAFAAERLAERGEELATRARWAAHLTALTTAATAATTAEEHRRASARLDAEAADLLEALRWAVATDQAEVEVRLAAPLARWSWGRGLLATMGELAEATDRLPSAVRLPPDLAGRLLWARAATRIAQGRPADAVPLLDRLVPHARQLGDAWLLGHALNAQAMTLPPDDPGLPVMVDDAIDMLRSSGDAWSVALALMFRGAVAAVAGDAEQAARTHRAALDLAATTGDDHLLASLFDQLAVDALLAGKLPEARGRLAEAADLHRQVHDQEGLAYCLDGLAAVALAQDSPELAGRLAGAADVAREQLGIVRWAPLRALAERFDRALLAALGSEGDRGARAAGAARGPWAALEDGLAGTATPDQQITAGSAAPVTAR